MTAVSILLVLIFDAVLCAAEIPDMNKKGLRREKWAFAAILSLGTVLAVVKSLGMDIPNPSDWVMAVYKPAADLMKGVFE